MDTTTQTKGNTEVVSTQAPAGAPKTPAQAPRGRFAPRGKRPEGRGDRGGFKERVKPEFDTKIISIRRVTRVASGGRRFSFSVAVVAGDKKGKVGVGTGKAVDTSIAIDKATRDAKKNMIKVNHTPTMSIPHPVEAKYCSARLMMMPAPGRGLIAGSSVRNVLELAGMTDIGAKLFSGSKNKLNNARVAIIALSRLTKNIKPAKVKAAPKA